MRRLALLVLAAVNSSLWYAILRVTTGADHDAYLCGCFILGILTAVVFGWAWTAGEADDRRHRAWREPARVIAPRVRPNEPQPLPPGGWPEVVTRLCEDAEDDWK